MPLGRLVSASFVMAGIFLAGTIGYHVIEHVPWWDAFYMTVITLTTVGYAEVFPLSGAGEVFTVVLLLVGLGMFLVLATAVAGSVLEGEIQRALGRVRRSRMIEHMSGHVVVCGYGRMGRAVVAELRHGRRNVVVVERSPDRIRRLQEQNVPVIDGDATSEATLRAARIDHAHGMVSCLNDDAHNVYAVLTARALNPHLFIVGRATEDDAERRIHQAGADRIVNPYNLGGTRLAHLVSKPAIVSFYDVASDTPDALQFDQVSLSGTSALAGKTLVELSLRQKWHLGVVAIQRGTEVLANPASDLTLAGGDVLAVFGTRQHIEAFERACAGT